MNTVLKHLSETIYLVRSLERYVLAATKQFMSCLPFFFADWRGILLSLFETYALSRIPQAVTCAVPTLKESSYLELVPAIMLSPISHHRPILQRSAEETHD